MVQQVNQRLFLGRTGTRLRAAVLARPPVGEPPEQSQVVTESEKVSNVLLFGIFTSRVCLRNEVTRLFLQETYKWTKQWYAGECS